MESGTGLASAFSSVPGHPTAAPSKAFAAQAFAESEDADAASQRSTDTSPFNEDVGTTGVAAAPSDAYSSVGGKVGARGERSELPADSSSSDDDEGVRFGRNHSDSSSDGQSLDSTPHKPYLLHPLRRPPGRMPGAVPPGYEEHAREDNPGVESCDLDSSSDEESENDSFSHHSRFQGGTPLNAPEVEGEEEDAMNASGYGDLSVHDVEEEQDFAGEASSGQMGMEEAATRASLLRHLRYLNQNNASGGAGTHTGDHTPANPTNPAYPAPSSGPRSDTAPQHSFDARNANLASAPSKGVPAAYVGREGNGFLERGADADAGNHGPAAPARVYLHVNREAREFARQDVRDEGARLPTHHLYRSSSFAAGCADVAPERGVSGRAYASGGGGGGGLGGGHTRAVTLGRTHTRP
eukprot:Tamp_15860.p1 GENE.Tamp_15860~~Tamp_15860.p1  ORF type:complete len:453 (-),score=60.03 Tamp_15860:150-1379(-)